MEAERKMSPSLWMRIVPFRVSLFVWVFSIAFVSQGKFEVLSSSREEKIQSLGDVVFGGLFPMHEKGKHGVKCGKIKKEKGIQRLEAMLYAVDKINNDNNLLPNITIGVHILDTCSFDTYALEQSMDFIKAQLSSIDHTEFLCQDGRPPISAPMRPVAGVIGAASSPVSIMVANILRLFKIPQISYASTSIDLSDETRFEYFSRVVPPDSYQAQAMVDIAKAFDWNYVITVADEGNYGEKGISAFEERAKNAGICVASSFEIPLSVTEGTFDHLIKDMLGVEKARAVIMFVNEDNSRGLLRALLQNNGSNNLAFLASDSWGKKIHPVDKQEQAAEGAVTLLPKRVDIPDFDTYFLNLTTKNNKRNPWFKEYWEATFNCSFEDEPKLEKCTGVESRSLRRIPHQQEGLVQFVIDSVYALAYAMHSLLLDKCASKPSLRSCVNDMTSLAGEDLLHHIRNISFKGVGGNVVRFDKSGDGLGGYDVFQFKKKTDNSYDYQLVGEWTDSLFLNSSLLRWRGDISIPPKSVCTEPCLFGYAKSTRGDTCCWVCVKCGDYEYLETESTCTKCPEGHKPDHLKSSCVRLPVLHLEWGSLWAIIPIVFASLGMLCTIFVLAVFIKYNTTPVIMASGRELCYVLLMGIFLSYGMSFVILAKPSIILCTVKRVGLGVSLCLIYSAMLTKTNRIYRIFNRGVKAMVKRPSYTSPKSQIVICFCLVSVQTVGGITWLGFEVPDTMFVNQGKDAVVLKCKATQIAIVISLFYNILLIIFCTVYAFKTRKIPQNFNEAKYIAFTMYSTCIVWLAFIPIYFGANNDFKIERTSLCMCISISAAVALACLFAPKVYIVLFQPHKNVRQVNNNSSTTQKSTNRPQFARQQNKFETCVTYNGSVVSSEIQRSPQNVFSDSFEDSSCDEGVAMQTPST